MKRYQYLYDVEGNAVCVDVNECTAGNHMCAPNAQCINQEGSHLCHCRHGYTGDGRVCESERLLYIFFYNENYHANIVTTQQELGRSSETLPRCGNVSARSTKFLLLVVTRIVLTSHDILEVGDVKWLKLPDYRPFTKFPKILRYLETFKICRTCSC